MAWPQPTDYNAAVQNPSHCFADAELRTAQADADALGLPRPRSGNAADVYQLTGPDARSWAVKCFTREAPGRDRRYRALAEHLGKARRSFLVDFAYLDQGVHIGPAWFPVVKMRWVEGFALNQFLAEHADQSGAVARLAHLWAKLGRELRDARIAHGDLQHGNVLLVPGQNNTLSLCLIDYDGLWVPGLADCPSGEHGHPNYQHPQRGKEGAYGPEMDRFALLVGYTALRALAASGKALWRRYDRGENLLFRESDFLEPGESDLLRDLATHPEAAVRALAGRLTLALQRPPEETPRLEDLLDGEAVRPLPEAETAQVREALRLSDGLKKRVRVAVAAGGARPPSLDPPPEESARPAPPRGRGPATPRPPSAAQPTAQNPALTTPPAVPGLPSPSAEQRRAAAAQFERANQVVATGNYDYGIQLLLSCCKLDPANLIYRQALRRTEKAKYRNNLRGHWLAWLTTLSARARLGAARRAGDHARALEHGEQVLLRNPWHVATQMRMAEAADALGLLDLAVWSLEQARQKAPRDPSLNRALAALYERRGNFTQAVAVWELVRRAAPHDVEAQQKVKDLAASETIARGHYEEAIEQASARAEDEAEAQGKAKARARDAAAAGPRTPPPPSAAPAPTAPAGSDRLTREVAPLLARLQADPTSAPATLQLAALYRRHGRLEEARTVLLQGLAPTGNAFELTAELADLEIEPFRRDLAIADEKLKADPDDAELERLRARLSKEIETRELDLFRRKSERFPMEMGHRLEVGLRLYRLGQTDEAIKELQAVRGDPRYQWRALYHLGHCFLARLNARLAQRNFEEALKALPAAGETEVRKELLYLLATAEADAGDFARAADLAAELAHLDYGYRDIGALLDEWQAKKKGG